ncbi:DapH/DapD/GlmU-related protein [Bradyrhizobium liaoningense]|uniref:acyltransferase n=1 Tax=Bradyrhizobium liaoningense TaxID=43992 RepID=UPI0024BF8523|nr:acyltransferase [Bradyrhizobium liaoningense]
MAQLGSGKASRLRTAALYDAPAHLCCADKTAVFHPTARVYTQGLEKERINVGAYTHIRGELTLFGHGGRITLGEYCYVGEQTRIWSAKEISIGNRVLISHMCTIMDNLTHPIDPAERHQQFRDMITTGHPRELDLDEQPVFIEDDALISCHCVVLRGVRIGRGAVIGAGSVVTRDIPPMVIAAGNPARVIRDIKPAETAS